MKLETEFGPLTYAAMVVAVAASAVVTFAITRSVLGTALGNGIAVVALTLLYAECRHREIATRRALAGFLFDFRRPPLGHVLLALCAVAVGVVVRLGAGAVRSLLAPARSTATHSLSKATDPTLAMVAFVVATVVLVGPLVEELVFRGLLQRTLSRHTTPALAIGLTAVSFAVLHIPNYGGFGTPLALLAVPLAVIAIDGVVWGWLYYRTGNLAVSWLAHAGSNALAVVLWIV